MKTFHIIRHAESLANIGEKTDRHDSIPLSDFGKEQARELAERISIIPDLIVVSPFSRTLETATPYIRKYPEIPVETWEVEEFTYLNPQIFNGTTPLERQKAVREYWDKEDIHYQDCDGVESYILFIHRIDRFLKRVMERPEQNIVVFSHGNFIYTLKEFLLLKEKGFSLEETAREIIKRHKTFTHETFPIGNVSIHKLCI